MKSNSVMSELTTMIKQIIYAMSSVFGKSTTLGAILAPLVALIAPITPIIYVMLFLVILDNISGIMKTFNAKGLKFCNPCFATFKHIQSNLLGKSIVKTLAYFMLILSGFLIDKFIIPELEINILTKVIAASIAFREFISIIENLDYITGKGLLSTVINIFKLGIKDGLGKSFEDSAKNKKK